MDIDLVTKLVEFGALGVLAMFEAFAIVFLWRHIQDMDALWRQNAQLLQNKIDEVHAKRMSEMQESVRALERSSAVLQQLTDVEKQRSAEIREFFERYGSRTENISRAIDGMQANMRSLAEEILHAVRDQRRRQPPQR